MKNIVAIIVENGSGKTNLLKMINRLINPTSGGENKSELDEVSLRRQIGYVIQQTKSTHHFGRYCWCPLGILISYASGISRPEAAKGIGLTPCQVLTKVQIPLSVPVIMAGVRIAAGGLVYLVFSGIRTVNNHAGNSTIILLSE